MEIRNWTETTCKGRTKGLAYEQMIVKSFLIRLKIRWMAVEECK